MSDNLTEQFHFCLQQPVDQRGSVYMCPSTEYRQNALLGTDVPFLGKCNEAQGAGQQTHRVVIWENRFVALVYCERSLTGRKYLQLLEEILQKWLAT